VTDAVQLCFGRRKTNKGPCSSVTPKSSPVSANGDGVVNDVKDVGDGDFRHAAMNDKVGSA